MKRENNYSILVKIKPEKKEIFCEGIIKIYPQKEMNILSFDLYKSLQLRSLKCNKKMRYEKTKEKANVLPDILETNKIKLYFAERILPEDEVIVSFEYGGKIDKATEYGLNRISEEFIELGIYAPWFPYCEEINKAKFNVHIDIDSRYKVVNSKKEGSMQVLEVKDRIYDCTIIASQRFKVIENCSERIKIKVFYINEKDSEAALLISKMCLGILEDYSFLGEVKGEDLAIVILPRNNGGGYCREGLIVLDLSRDYTDEIEIYHFLAHELAHLWWSKIKNYNSWEDWLNESFAEYSSLMVLKESYGEEVFENFIMEYRKQSMNIPAIKEAARNSEYSYRVFYRKGPIVLYTLNKFIGENKFNEFLKLFYLSEAESTEEVLEILKTVAGVNAKNKLLELLLW